MSIQPAAAFSQLPTLQNTMQRKDAATFGQFKLIHKFSQMIGMLEFII